MNTEPVFTIPDEVAHDVKKSSYEKFDETIRFVEYSPDASA